MPLASKASTDLTGLQFAHCENFSETEILAQLEVTGGLNAFSLQGKVCQIPVLIAQTKSKDFEEARPDNDLWNQHDSQLLPAVQGTLSGISVLRAITGTLLTFFLLLVSAGFWKSAHAAHA
eukprot:s341_g1.t1